RSKRPAVARRRRDGAGERRADHLKKCRTAFPLRLGCVTRVKAQSPTFLVTSRMEEMQAVPSLQLLRSYSLFAHHPLLFGLHVGITERTPPDLLLIFPARLSNRLH